MKMVKNYMKKRRILYHESCEIRKKAIVWIWKSQKNYGLGFYCTGDNPTLDNDMT